MQLVVQFGLTNTCLVYSMFSQVRFATWTSFVPICFQLWTTKRFIKLFCRAPPKPPPHTHLLYAFTYENNFISKLFIYMLEYINITFIYYFNFF